MDLNHLNLRVRDATACRDFYERHFGFRLAFEADGGYFVRNDEGFLLALIPADPHQALPDGFHIGFGVADAEAVTALNRRLAATGLAVTEIEDFRPAEDYVTFRCWDPDGTEVEVFWEAPPKRAESTSSAVSARDELLAALVGEWSGTYRLWLEPGELRTETPTRCTGRPVLDGRFAALDYDWIDADGPQLGSMLLGCSEDGEWQMAWVDSWHTGTSIMYCVGGPEADVVGTYGPQWGWRTRFDLASPNEMVITAWNITPAGDEAKATRRHITGRSVRHG